MALVWLILLFTVLDTSMVSCHSTGLTDDAATVHQSHSLSPDNTCGGTKGYICDPNAAMGGPCCSQHGFCGDTPDYCGLGCQQEFSNPGCSAVVSSSSSSSMAPLSRLHGHGHHTHLFRPQITRQSLPEPQSLPTQPTSSTKPPLPLSEPNNKAAESFGRGYRVEGLGLFTHYAHYTFDDGTLPQGLARSDYLVQSSPLNHVFLPDLVQFEDGLLWLKVPGGSYRSPVPCAEVTTIQKDIKYASVRTRAMFSNVPGTCHGQFFYASDTQEIDVEYLTDPRSRSNDNGKKIMQYTNQAISGIPGSQTYSVGPPPTNCGTIAHEYRIDWTEGRVEFWIDNVLQKSMTTNVPTEGGSWCWNNWANGDPGWTMGPPKEDNIFKIESIEMFYNRTGSSGDC